MTDEATFTLTLDAALRDRFVAEADAALRPADDLLRELMRDFVARRQSSREAEILADIEQALREAGDLETRFVSQEEVKADWLRQREALIRRIGDDAA